MGEVGRKKKLLGGGGSKHKQSCNAAPNGAKYCLQSMCCDWEMMGGSWYQSSQLRQVPLTREKYRLVLGQNGRRAEKMHTAPALIVPITVTSSLNSYFLLGTT